MKRLIFIFFVVLCYLMVISTVMAYLPFANTPDWLMNNGKVTLARYLLWTKIRHTAVVFVAGLAVALLFVKFDNKRAKSDAWGVGVTSVTFALLQAIRTRYWIYKDFNMPPDWNVFTWIEITDYLVILLAIPFLVSMINARGGQKP